MSPAPLPAGQARVSGDAAQPGAAAQQTPAKSGVGRQVRYNQGTATLEPLIAMAYTLEDLRHATLRLLIKDTPGSAPRKAKPC